MIATVARFGPVQSLLGGGHEWLSYAMVALAVLGLAAIVWVATSSARKQGPGEDDSPGGGSGGQPRPGPAPGPPSAEPDWWPEFERQFAEHVHRARAMASKERS